MKLRLPMTLCIACLMVTPALADGPLDEGQLGTLITGNTLYVEVPPGAPGAPDGGTAPIHYGMDGSAKVKLPAGLELVGTWSLDGDQYCIDWENGPKNSCSRLTRVDDGFLILDVASQAPRGVVRKIAVGNAEGL